jgi:hypothetical protein
LEAKLSAPQFLDALQKRADELAFYGLVAEAAQWLNDLKASMNALPDFPLRHPEEHRLLMRIFALMKWTALQALNNEAEVEELFERHVMTAFAVDGFNVGERVRTWLLTYPFFTDRDRLKGMLRSALERNREQLRAAGDQEQDVSAPRTVGAWLKKAFDQMGRKRFSALDINSFLSRDQFARRLGSREQEALRAIIGLYGRLQKSSFSVDGLEEELPIDEEETRGTVREGRFDPITDAELERAVRGLEDARKIIVSVHSNQLIEQYEQWAKETVVAGALDAFRKMGSAPGGVPPKALDGWYASINTSDVSGVMVKLWQIAQAGKVRSLLGASPRYRAYWRKHLPPALKEKEEEFEKDPAAPQFLAGFLRHILVERMKLKEESAKMVILTLSNEARKAGEEEYSHLAYGDLQTGEFRWGT